MQTQKTKFLAGLLLIAFLVGPFAGLVSASQATPKAQSEAAAEEIQEDLLYGSIKPSLPLPEAFAVIVRLAKQEKVLIKEMRSTVELKEDIITWGMGSAKDETLDQFLADVHEMLETVLLEDMKPEERKQSSVEKLFQKSQVKLFTLEGPSAKITKLKSELEEYAKSQAGHQFKLKQVSAQTRREWKAYLKVYLRQQELKRLEEQRQYEEEYLGGANGRPRTLKATERNIIRNNP